MAKAKIIKRTSDKRRVHETGAQRDMNEKKGRMDLVPAVALKQFADFCTNFSLSKCADDIRENCMNSSIIFFWNAGFRGMYDWLEGERDPVIFDNLGFSLWNIMQVMSLEETGEIWYPKPATGLRHGIRYDMIYPNWLRRVSIHYQSGGEAHGFRNWEKGMPVMWQWDSATRHLYNWIEKEETEDHLAAHGWNVCGMIHGIEMVKRGMLPKSIIEDVPESYLKKS
jgi:hypothetical protein